MATYGAKFMLDDLTLWIKDTTDPVEALSNIEKAKSGGLTLVYIERSNLSVERNVYGRISPTRTKKKLTEDELRAEIN